MEPSHFVNFRPQGGNGRRAPRLYAQLLEAAYVAMHAVRPVVVVISGNVHPAGSNDDETTAPDTFLRYMVLPNGRWPRLDMFEVNPTYTERPIEMVPPKHPRRDDFNDLDWLTRQLDRYWPRRRLQLFIEEFGWNTEHEARGWLYVVSRKKQAENLSKAHRVAARLTRITMCWHQLCDERPYKQGTVWLNWTSALRTWSGTRKPSWRAFRVLPGPKRTCSRARPVAEAHVRLYRANLS